MTTETLKLDLPRFVTGYPTTLAGLNLRAGAWKKDFESLTFDEVEASIAKDGRPRFCAQTFEGFEKFDILELGPAEGYLTASLEFHGAKSVTAIEANADNFIKSCILKNVLGLKSTFLLGDFLKYLEEPPRRYDLVFAAGVMYHLEDPIDFLEKCCSVADNILIWTLYYVDETIKNHPFESRCFKDVETINRFGREFKYYRGFYDPTLRSAPKYQGGIHESANWMTLDDIEVVLKSLNFEIRRVVHDSANRIDAINILASKIGRQ